MSLAAEAPATSPAARTSVKDGLDHARVAAQHLHAMLSDAVAKRGGAIKTDLETIPNTAQAIIDSIKLIVGAQNAAIQNCLGDAMTYLDATKTHATEAFENSGHAAESSLHRAIAAARAAVQRISEAVAAKRSDDFTAG